jgi:hypothetical protein
VICAIGAGVFVFARWWSTAMPEITLPGKMDEAGLIKWLGSYRDWYKKSAKRCERVTMACRIIPIIAGFTIAVLSALREQGRTPLDEYYNVTIILLSGLSTLSVAIMTQLGIADLAKAREIGRIECAKLLSRAQIFHSSDHPLDKVYQEKLSIHAEIFRIEHHQAELYASIVAGQPLSDRSNGTRPFPGTGRTFGAS